MVGGPGLRRFVRWFLLPNHRRRNDRMFVEAVARLCSEITADVARAHDRVGLVAITSATRQPLALIYDAHKCRTGRGGVGRPEWVGPGSTGAASGVSDGKRRWW